jgi:hypothetical protein
VGAVAGVGEGRCRRRHARCWRGRRDGRCRRHRGRGRRDRRCRQDARRGVQGRDAVQAGDRRPVDVADRVPGRARLPPRAGRAPRRAGDGTRDRHGAGEAQPNLDRGAGRGRGSDVHAVAGGHDVWDAARAVPTARPPRRRAARNAATSATPQPWRGAWASRVRVARIRAFVTWPPAWRRRTTPATTQEAHARPGPNVLRAPEIGDPVRRL